MYKKKLDIQNEGHFYEILIYSDLHVNSINKIT